MIIDHVTCQSYRIPLAKPWGDQTHHITHIELLVTEIYSDSGRKGTGFAYSVGVGIKAVEALLKWDVIPKLIGQTVHPQAIWYQLWRELHDTGGGGTSTLALSAIDIGLWDLFAQELERPLVDVLGRLRPGIPVYGSGVNLHLSLSELETQVQRWVDSGYGAVKIKVGKADLLEDIKRLQATREILGPSRYLMIDANQGWDLPTAEERIRAYASFGLRWVEEPLLSDDIRGHQILRQRVQVPIAIGENVYTKFQVNDYLRSGACDYLQADVVRVGGISPFLEIAAIASAYNVPMAPHFLRELSGQVLCCISNGMLLEDVEGGSFTELGILSVPLPVVKGMFYPPEVPGHGIAFQSNVLDQFRLDENPSQVGILWHHNP